MGSALRAGSSVSAEGSVSAEIPRTEENKLHAARHIKRKDMSTGILIWFVVNR